MAKVKVCAARLVGENDQPVLVPTIEEGDNFWTTSHGRFRFTVDELPPELQLLYGLLNVSGRIDRLYGNKELSRICANVMFIGLSCMELCFLAFVCYSLFVKGVIRTC